MPCLWLMAFVITLLLGFFMPCGPAYYYFRGILLDFKNMEDCLLILDTDCQLSRVFPTRIQKVWESLNFMTYLCLSSKQRHCVFRGIHHEFNK